MVKNWYICGKTIVTFVITLFLHMYSWPFFYICRILHMCPNFFTCVAGLTFVGSFLHLMVQQGVSVLCFRSYSLGYL